MGRGIQLTSSSPGINRADLHPIADRDKKRERMKPIIATSKMNGTEARMAQELEIRKRAGEILDYRFEGIKLRLADNTFYTPDFFIVHRDHFEVMEVKGFWRDDARVKIKVAAQMYPWFRFVAVQRKKNQWIYEQVNKLAMCATY